MPFSFLNPWFWVAALAVGVPLWLHLRRKREKKIVAFSAVRFLHDQPRPRRNPLRMENLLLFLLRAAALVLLTAAFSWPYVRPEAPPGVDESRVYILDNTLSQQANGRFKDGRERILRELRGAPASTRIAVVELTSSPRLATTFSDSRELAAEKIGTLSPSHQRGSYLAAFQFAAGLLQNAPAPHKRIVFIGDNQANQWTEATNAPPFLHGIETEVVRSEARTLPNVSLSQPSARRVFMGDKSLVSFAMNLNRYGDVRTAKVLIRAKGQTILSREVTLAGQPETQAVQAEWEVPPGTAIQGEATVEADRDALPEDNRVFFTVPPVMEGRVALLAQSPYLRLALSPEVMRGRWAATVVEPAAVENARVEADVLCIESGYFGAPRARALISDYLTAGRGVILFVNQFTPAIKGYLHGLGFEADTQAEKPLPEAEPVQFVVPNHPLFQGFASGQYGGLLDVTFSRYARLKSREATPLMFAGGGAGLIFEARRGPGRLYLAAFGMDREHTSWPVHPTFIPFLDLALQSARGMETERTSFEPGELASISAPKGVPTSQGVLQEDSTVLARAEVSGGRARLRLPDKPGLYTIVFGPSGSKETIAVNNPEKESELVYADSVEAPQQWKVKVAQQRRERRVLSLTGPLAAQVLRQRIWWWLLLGAVAALLLEALIADRTKATA